eukprot:674553_1
MSTLMKLFLLITIIVSHTFIAMGQYDIIWEESMTGTVSLDDWILDGTVESKADTYCPILNENCWQLCGDNSVGIVNKYLYRTASTLNYEQIQLIYSVSTQGMNTADATQYCELSFSTMDIATDKWTVIGQYQHTDRLVDETYNFEQGISNQQQLIIRIMAQPNSGGSDCCRIRDFALKGIPITAQNTPNPTTKEPTTTTKAPTTKEPTTRQPTTTPPTTKEPTTRQPTTTPPTTKTPTTAITAQEPTTKAPTTKAPTTKQPTTKAPTTKDPTTRHPTTSAPTTKQPTTTTIQPTTTTTTTTKQPTTTTTQSTTKQPTTTTQHTTKQATSTAHPTTTTQAKSTAFFDTTSTIIESEARTDAGSGKVDFPITIDAQTVAIIILLILIIVISAFYCTKKARKRIKKQPTQEFEFGEFGPSTEIPMDDVPTLTEWTNNRIRMGVPSNTGTAVRPKLKNNNSSSVSSSFRRKFESFHPMHRVHEPHSMLKEDGCEIVPGSLPKGAPNIHQNDSLDVDCIWIDMERDKDEMTEPGGEGTGVSRQTSIQTNVEQEGVFMQTGKGMVKLPQMNGNQLRSLSIMSEGRVRNRIVCGVNANIAMPHHMRITKQNGMNAMHMTPQVHKYDHDSIAVPQHMHNTKKNEQATPNMNNKEYSMHCNEEYKHNDDAYALPSSSMTKSTRTVPPVNKLCT